jgi:diacylglycerol O-acyltransferase / wax synthase
MQGMGQQRALTDADAIVWIVERDPALRSTIIALAVLDRVPDFSALRERVERATRLVPKLRQTVQATTPDGGSPVWVTQPDLDLDRHLRRIACPAPGTRAEMLKLA